ncbi:bifunctional 4-hydroxy-2-oxoglutarate aldolase/2-dehydro-3-deoxy-phosphogluconate aldolase [Actinoplanes bogorensis]|uniref:Bifunctional 4-hydroxy-2-oxoglutarate aldolase/2-dehydro-3-deoxy-phosphogluconate aldolase n=1 Tax=Paractinoplanes bogorensis TaxID=1610840 RepID=A0ABS5Z3E6_9ACTN|nr:bifunctional 4-hydroxy-2-oxoglutarate aldolase/2-dehydro-3-deoxy-phosphogluconate aldolase [Actinoplanes bogorensis]MBU2670193.1 bifunctional 4-hydroxy-2-oxoglutarate aldolase/2-dehydro-3-deoxy-phosphogluconate aldolase [Actinoplanes bogorensis]
MKPAKLVTLNAITDTKVVLIVRLPTAEQSYDVARRAIEGGVRAVEITLTTPGAMGVVERLATEHPEIHIGAGTVLDAHAAYTSISAGARFLVSPQVNTEMIRLANRYQVPTVVGAMTPTEIVTAAEAGADLVKVFPTEAMGRAAVKSVLAPLAHIPLVPAGGATPDNVHEWLAAGVAAIGVGSYITKADDVAANARHFLDVIARAS